MATLDERLTALEIFAHEHFGYEAGAIAAVGINSLQTLMNSAKSWLANDSNVVTPDSTGTAVVQAFKVAFPTVEITNVGITQVAPSAPGLPPTGLYRVSISIAPPGTAGITAEINAKPTPPAPQAVLGANAPASAQPSDSVGTQREGLVKVHSNNMMAGPNDFEWVPVNSPAGQAALAGN